MWPPWPSTSPTRKPTPARAPCWPTTWPTWLLPRPISTRPRAATGAATPAPDSPPHSWAWLPTTTFTAIRLERSTTHDPTQTDCCGPIRGLHARPHPAQHRRRIRRRLLHPRPRLDHGQFTRRNRRLVRLGQRGRLRPRPPRRRTRSPPTPAPQPQDRRLPHHHHPGRRGTVAVR